MKTALLGYSGFVGTTLLKQISFSDLYNSKNIHEIRNKRYNLVVSAANPSAMWKANLEPEKDWENIKSFIEIIKTIDVDRFILLSTIEVYNQPKSVNEESAINPKGLKPYGKHRYALEEFIRKQFKKHTIIRLPNLFGEGLKKNFIYDLIHNNRLDLTHKDNEQQWYDLKNIWKDITIAVSNELSLVNFAVEPVDCVTVANYAAEIAFTTITEAPPRKYNMQTKYAKLYKSNGQYLYQRTETLTALKKFIEKERSLL